MVWAPGQSLQGGKYIIDRVLGVGGFGITYRAIQNHRRHDQQTVVIKTLKDEVRHDPKLAHYQTKLQQDFLNEALKLAKCFHSHIVEVQEIIREGDLDCIVMEFIEGESLADRLSRKGSLLESEALRYIQQVGDALTVVHKRGLFHRDIKPQNIMIRSGTSEAVLIDFGLAREFIQDLTQTHSLALTHGFAPPEQYNQTTKRGAYTDVYALAATLYCLLTGYTPPPGFMRLSGTALESPKQLNSNISDRVNQAILKGLELQPGDRPQSMQAWLSLLEESRFSPPPASRQPDSQIPLRQSTPQSPRKTPRTQSPPPQPIPQSLRETSQPLTRSHQPTIRSRSRKWLTVTILGYTVIGTVFFAASAPPVIFGGVGVVAMATAGFEVVFGARAGEKLLESFSRFHAFLILAGASLAGLGLDWLVGWALQSLGILPMPGTL